MWERNREVAQRKERERLEFLNEEDADLSFLMPRNILFKVLFSRPFPQRLRLLADPSRAGQRKPCVCWSGPALQRLEAHLSRLSSIVAALRYDDLESTHRAMIEMPASSRVMSSPMYGLSLASDADSLALSEPSLILGLAAAGLDLVWHGTSGGVSAMENICRTGFADLSSKLNVGWHGRGMYFTLYAPYADYYFLCGGHRPENLTPEGEHALLLSWALIGTAYPVLERMDRVDDPEHLFHGGYPGHDSHYALVNDGGATCTEYTPVLRAKYDEIMIWQESQVLPLAIVFFKLE